MNNKQRIGLTFLGIACLGLLAYWLSFSASPAKATSPYNFAAATSTTSTISASSTAGFFINANRNCVNRVISTASTTIMLGFGSTTPTAVIGHWQAASSTVAYPAENYGCNQWTVYGFNTGTITITEFYQ